MTWVDCDHSNMKAHTVHIQYSTINVIGYGTPYSYVCVKSVLYILLQMFHLGHYYIHLCMNHCFILQRSDMIWCHMACQCSISSPVTKIYNGLHEHRVYITGDIMIFFVCFFTVHLLFKPLPEYPRSKNLGYLKSFFFAPKSAHLWGSGDKHILKTINEFFLHLILERSMWINKSLL